LFFEESTEFIKGVGFVGRETEDEGERGSERGLEKRREEEFESEEEVEQVEAELKFGLDVDEGGFENEEGEFRKHLEESLQLFPQRRDALTSELVSFGRIVGHSEERRQDVGTTLEDGLHGVEVDLHVSVQGLFFDVVQRVL
jgi:hypothetical protein